MVWAAQVYKIIHYYLNNVGLNAQSFVCFCEVHDVLFSSQDIVILKFNMSVDEIVDIDFFSWQFGIVNDISRWSQLFRHCFNVFHSRHRHHDLSVFLCKLMDTSLERLAPDCCEWRHDVFIVCCCIENVSMDRVWHDINISCWIVFWCIRNWNYNRGVISLSNDIHSYAHRNILQNIDNEWVHYHRLNYWCWQRLTSSWFEHFTFHAKYFQLQLVFLELEYTLIDDASFQVLLEFFFLQFLQICCLFLLFFDVFVVFNLSHVQSVCWGEITQMGMV